jgi:hypothetical protein
MSDLSLDDSKEFIWLTTQAESKPAQTAGAGVNILGPQTGATSRKNISFKTFIGKRLI